jgi:hypothetical protein
MSDKPYMMAREIADACNRNYQRVLNEIRAGRLSAVTLGGTYLVPTHEAEDYIAKALAEQNVPVGIVEKLQAKIASLEAENATLRGAA